MALEQKEGSNRMQSILSTHPLTSIRIKQASKIIKSLQEKEYDSLTSKNFEVLKKYLLE